MKLNSRNLYLWTIHRLIIFFEIAMLFSEIGQLNQYTILRWQLYFGQRRYIRIVSRHQRFDKKANVLTFFRDDNRLKPIYQLFYG